MTTTEDLNNAVEEKMALRPAATASVETLAAMAMAPMGDLDKTDRVAANDAGAGSGAIVKEAPNLRSHSATCYLGFCSFAFIIGSSFLYGYNVGNLNSPANVINETFYVVTYARRRNETAETADEAVGQLTVALWKVTIALFVAGGAIGSVGSSWFCEKLGRRKANAINQIPFLLCGIVSAVAKFAGAPEMLMVGRFLAGLGAGAGCTYVPVYLTEIAPTKIRGAVATLHQLAITVGILVAQVLSLPVIWGNERWWPVLVGFVAVPAAVSLLFLPFCVETPRFLYITKGDLAAATKALQRLRGRENVEDELDEIKREKDKRDGEVDAEKVYTIKMLLKDKANRLPLAATVALQVLQQWSGINAIFFYSAMIFEDAGVAVSDIPYAVVLTGLVNVVTTIIAIFIIEKAGRRKLILFPCLLIAIIYLLLTACLTVKSKQERSISTLRDDYKNQVPLSQSVDSLKEYLNCTSTDAMAKCDHIDHSETVTYYMSIISIVCIILYIISFALGIGPIPFYVSTEMFRQGPRAAACSIAQGVNWACNLVLSLTFIYLQNGLGSLTFVPFLLIVAFIGSFVFLRIPETKGKSFEEIAQVLNRWRGPYRSAREEYDYKEKSNTLLDEFGDKC